VLSSSSGLILVGSADAGRIRTFQLASRVGKMEHGHLSELTGMSANRVRRERCWFTAGWTRPGTGSLHPVAIGAAVEATRLLKPLVRRVAFRDLVLGTAEVDEIGRSGRAWIRQGRVGSRLGWRFWPSWNAREISCGVAARTRPALENCGSFSQYLSRI